MKKIVECPFCPGTAVLSNEKKTLNFRKEEFIVVAHFYQCNSCQEEFTNTETDELTYTQVYNQYREKHNIPFPEELTNLRERYGVSAARMSSILGFGTNTYSNYENGEMPTPANANLIRTASAPKIFLTLLDNSDTAFKNTSAFRKIKKNVVELSEKQDSHESYLPFDEKPAAVTGYRLFNLVRLKNILIYLLNSCNSEHNDRIKINKLLFYIDFLHYRNFGKSVSGIKYRAIPYGPAPAYYDRIIDFIYQDLSFSISGKRSANHVVEVFSTNEVYNPSIFTLQEQCTLDEVVNKFKDVSSWDIMQLSHKERSWIELSPKREVINYQEYAFDLSIL